MKPEATSAKRSLKKGAQLGPYEIRGFLGAGGMGEVYLARDTKLEREIAIKVLPAKFVNDANRLSRFQREARMLAALNHPNIATIYGLEKTGDRQYLVMERIEGQTLGMRLSAGPLPIHQVLDLGIQLTDALETAHAKGIIHRDIKPANIILTKKGQAKILDFGGQAHLCRNTFFGVHRQLGRTVK